MIPLSTSPIDERQRRPVASTLLRTGGLIGAVMLAGLLAACSADLSDVGASLVAAPQAPSRTAAEKNSIFERLDHSEVNRHSAAHESDLPGASIAEYGQTPDPVVALPAEPFESGFVGSAL